MPTDERPRGSAVDAGDPNLRPADVQRGLVWRVVSRVTFVAAVSALAAVFIPVEFAFVGGLLVCLITVHTTVYAASWQGPEDPRETMPGWVASGGYPDGSGGGDGGGGDGGGGDGGGGGGGGGDGG